MLRSVETTEIRLHIPYENRRIFALALSPDSSRLAVGASRIGTSQRAITVDVRAVPSGELLWSREEPDDRLTLSFSGDGTRLGTGVAANARIFDAATGTEVAPLEGSLVGGIEFSPSMPIAASPNFDGTVHLYDTRDGEQGLEIPLPDVTDLVSSMERAGTPRVRFSPDGRRLAVAGGAGIIRVFDFGATGLSMTARWDHRESVRALAFLPESDRLVVTDLRHRLMTFALDTPTPYHEVVVLGEDGGVSLTGDAGLAVGGGFDWTAKAYNTRTGEEVFSSDGVSIERVVASRDGHSVAVLDRHDERTARVYDLRTAALRRELDLGVDALRIAMSDDGRLLAAALDRDRDDRTDSILVLDIERGTPIPVADCAPLHLLFDPSAARLACANQEGLTMLDLAGGRTASRVSDLPDVRSMAFSPDGRILAGGYRDGAFRILDAATGNVRAERSQGGVLAVAFSPDGAHIAAGGQDLTVRVYRSDSGQEVARQHYDDPVRGLAFTADGRHLVTSTGARVEHRQWRAEDLVAEACARLTRNLTLEEWRQYLPDEPYRKTCDNLPDATLRDP
jgi:WD40 repeat protein